MDLFGKLDDKTDGFPMGSGCPQKTHQAARSHTAWVLQL